MLTDEEFEGSSVTPEGFEGEIIEDATPYEGDPLYVAPVDFQGMQDDEGVTQDESILSREIVGLLQQAAPSINDWRETLEWYKTHRTKELIGFDPDGMCLKIHRSARDIPARYLTARESMLATPEEHRIHKVRNLRKGMVAYHADPFDNNPADHITGVIGRMPNFDPDDLNDVLMVTNSIEADRLTVVRGTYFEQHWGDDFKFGATWLNGYELDIPQAKAVEEHETKVERFHGTAPLYNLRLLARADRPKAQRILDQINTQVRRLPDSPKLVRVHEFKLQVKDDKILDLRILDEAVKAGRVGIVRTVRDNLRQLIGALPDE